MDVILEVKEKLKRKNQILFDKKSLFFTRFDIFIY